MVGMLADLFRFLQLAAVPRGGYLLNQGAATAVGKLIIGVAKAKGIKTINLVRCDHLQKPSADVKAGTMSCGMGARNRPWPSMASSHAKFSSLKARKRPYDYTSPDRCTHASFLYDPVTHSSRTAEARPLSQVRNKNRFEELRALGADEIIDVTTEDVVARTKAVTGVLAVLALVLW